MLVLLIVLILDQSFKIWIKTNMNIGEEFGILGLSWARIHFIENPGMAFGIEIGGQYGKLFLSIFRIVAVFFLIYIIRQLIITKEPVGLIICFTLILAGAIGNILDSAFYGLIFSESPYHGGVAEMFPELGYAGFLKGKVVDMLYFPMIDTYLPKWLPIFGGNKFEFFRPVFNIADSAISIGVISILLFYRSIFFKSNDEKKEATNISADQEE